MLLTLAIAGAFAATLLPSGSGPVPPLPHTFAAVNDTLSHGLVGDNFLSLNEAIQLHNQTLLYTQLSPAEQAQMALIPGTGTATYVSWVRIDASVTSTITIQQDLDVIVNTNYGLFFSSDNGRVVLDFSGANLTRGMRSTSNSLQMRDLVFSGGPYGLDVVQTDISGQIGLAVQGCEFENQSQWGVRVSSTTANGFGKVYLEACRFDGCTTGIVFDEAVSGRTTFFDLHDCRISNVTDGVLITVGNGGMGRYIIERNVIEATGKGLDLQRPSAADRTALIQLRHLDVRANQCATIACSAAAPTTISIRMAHLWSTTTGTSLALGTPGDDVSGAIEDSTFDGLFSARTGGGTLPLILQNVRIRNASVSLGASTTQALSVIDSRLDSCSTAVNGGAAPVAFTNCCVPDGLLYGTAQSPVHCTDSYVYAGNPGSFVTVTSPRSAAQLGGMHVLPDVPTIGSTVTFQADLPTGLFGFFLLGFTDANPALSWGQPLHVYGQLNSTWLLPGVYRLQQTLPWVVPNWPAFIGLDLVAQIAILPDPNVSALPVQLAPGRRFALQ